MTASRPEMRELRPSPTRAAAVCRVLSLAETPLTTAQVEESCSPLHPGRTTAGVMAHLDSMGLVERAPGSLVDHWRLTHRGARVASLEARTRLLAGLDGGAEASPAERWAAYQDLFDAVTGRV